VEDEEKEQVAKWRMALSVSYSKCLLTCTPERILEKGNVII
jgi:hypothetical protein